MRVKCGGKQHVARANRAPLTHYLAIVFVEKTNGRDLVQLRLAIAEQGLSLFVCDDDAPVLREKHGHFGVVDQALQLLIGIRRRRWQERIVVMITHGLYGCHGAVQILYIMYCDAMHKM
ncbi:MAG: hypothetical protein U5O39_01795 [Gammaproteobacteria bacterium]|nr:hypothetical protein [Gammaproteobacteria bacterium]